MSLPLNVQLAIVAFVCSVVCAALLLWARFHKDRERESQSPPTCPTCGDDGYLIDSNQVIQPCPDCYDRAGI